MVKINNAPPVQVDEPITGVCLNVRPIDDLADRVPLVEWNSAGQGFPITSAYFHISANPALPGLIEDTFSLEPGQTADLYIVGPVIGGTDGLTNAGQINAYHFTASYDGTSVTYAPVEARIGTGYGAHPGPINAYPTVSFNDLAPIATAVFGSGLIDNAFTLEVKNLPEASFTLDYCATNTALIGQTGIQVDLTARNLAFGEAPLSFAIQSFSGDLENPVIFPALGTNSAAIFYDSPDVFVDEGRGSVIVEVTTSKGKTRVFEVCTQARDPVEVAPLACESDVEESWPELAGATAIHALKFSERSFQDNPGTVPAGDGDPVKFIQGENGGDLFIGNDVRRPILDLADSSGFEALRFDGANDLLLASTGLPSSLDGSFLFLFRGTTNPATNDSYISGGQVANPAATDVSPFSWQICHGNGGGDTTSIWFRIGNPYASVAFGQSPITDADILLATPAHGSIDGGIHLIAVSVEGGVVKTYFDGVQRGEATLSGPIGFNAVRIGTNRNLTANPRMDLFEMFVGAAPADFDRLQAYFLCKYNLNAALFSSPGPFEVGCQLFPKISQFELHTFFNQTQQVWDTVTQAYFPVDAVPVPGLGVFESKITRAIIEAAGNGTNEPVVLTVADDGEDLVTGDYQSNSSGGAFTVGLAWVSGGKWTVRDLGAAGANSVFMGDAGDTFFYNGVTGAGPLEIDVPFSNIQICAAATQDEFIVEDLNPSAQKAGGSFHNSNAFIENGVTRLVLDAAIGTPVSVAIAANNQIQVQKTTLWEVQAKIATAGTVDNGTGVNVIRILVNGVIVAEHAEATLGNNFNDPVHFFFAKKIQLNAGDLVAVEFTVNPAGVHQIPSDPARTYVDIYEA